MTDPFEWSAVDIPFATCECCGHEIDGAGLCGCGEHLGDEPEEEL